MSTTLAFTGHRPASLGGYDATVSGRLLKVATAYLTKVAPTKVISGMALGWDTEVAFAAIRLGIPVVAAIPFEGQSSIWPQASRDRYNRILDKCSERIIVSPGDYSTKKLFIRNEWMVDNSDKLVALWNGATQGGTYSCVKYAQSQSVPVVNLWPEWLAAGGCN